MARTKENRNAYDNMMKEKCGISGGTIQAQLIRKQIFHLAKKLSLPNQLLCCVCKNPIEFVEEMTIEHLDPHGTTSGKENFKQLFFDPNNLSLAHPDCNEVSLKGEVPIIGTHILIHCNNKWRQMIHPDNTHLVLGYYQDCESAALIYDLASLVFRNGRGRLNYQDWRQKYRDILSNYKIEDKVRFFDHQNKKEGGHQIVSLLKEEALALNLFKEYKEKLEKTV